MHTPPRPLITGWSVHNLPPKYSIIRTTNGRLYEVDQPIPEDREYGDSSAGFVYAYRLDERGNRTGKRRTSVYAYEIAGKLDLS